MAQVRNYVRDHPRVEAQTLFILWGGAANFFEEDAAVDETVEQAIEDLKSWVSLLVKAGAQTILVGNQISEGFSAEMRTNNREAYFHQITTSFNKHLAHHMEQWQQQFPAKLILADVAGLADAVLTDAQQFGFDNVTGTCMVDEVVCAEPEGYLYWQGVHFTTAFHCLLAERFNEAITAAYA